MKKQENAIKEKTCNKCNETKSISDFYKRTKSKDGLTEQCKLCKNVYDKAYNKINNQIPEVKASRLEYQNSYTKTDKCKETTKKYRQTENYKITRRKTEKRRYDKKYGIDIEWTLKLILRNRVKNALKNNFKFGKTLELLGCTIDEYKIHLESLFTPEMNWDNYGKDKYWEIDHIIPCDSFNLLDEEEQRKCFNYINTQPMEILKNRQKSNKL